MTDQPVQVKLPDGRDATAREVAVKESNEKWCEYTLEDGTKFRAKFTLVSVWKVEGEKDPQGNPVVLVNATPTIVVTKAGSEPKAS